jgi:hypothetical protein
MIMDLPARKGNAVNLKNVPTGAWIFASVAVLGALGALVVLQVSGQDTTNYWRLLNFAWNGLLLVATGGSVIYSGAAAKNSQDAKEQTNGLLTAERQQIARDAAAAAVAAYRKETGQ